MSKGYPTEKGLYQLTEATPAQVAAFIGATEDTVVRDFRNRPDLYEQPDTAPADLWRLSRFGRESVEAELAASRARGYLAEPEAAERRVLDAIAGIQSDLDQVALDPFEEDADDFLGLLELRLNAATKSVGRLKAAGRAVGQAVLSVTASSQRIAEIRVLRRGADESRMAEKFETSVESYVRAWADLWPGDEKFVPERATSGPVVVVNATAAGEDVAQRIVNNARIVSSPVIAIQTKDLSTAQTSRELDRLGEFLSSVAGAATKVVFVVDGRAAASEAFALRCVTLDHVRATSRREFNPAAPYVQLTSVMQSTLHVAHQKNGDETAFVDFFEHNVSSMAKCVTWAILRLVTISPKQERRRSWSDLDPGIFCLDIGESASFATNFEGTTVSYVGLSDFNATKGSSMRPLDGARHHLHPRRMLPLISPIPEDRAAFQTSSGAMALIVPPTYAFDVQAGGLEVIGGGALLPQLAIARSAR